MKEDPPSLSNLHDLVSPAEVGWWPLAAGWYVVGVLACAVLLQLVARAWKQWKTNAYRREALRELNAAESIAAMIAILRRTALALVPRSEIAGLKGEEWAEWIAVRGPRPVSSELRDELAQGAYQRDTKGRNPENLRNYIRNWIQHQDDVEKIRGKESEC